MGSSNLRQRILVAIIGVPILFALAILGGFFLLAAVDLVILIGSWEFFEMASKKGASPNRILGIIGALAISWDFCLAHVKYTPIIVVATLILLLIYELWRKGTSSPIINISSTLLGIFFVGFLLSHLLLIRQLPGVEGVDHLLGGYLVVLVFSLVWICDTAAYFVGTHFSKHKLFPRVSPNKTIEGTVGGLLGAVAMAMVAQIFLSRILKVHDLITFDYLLLGCLAGTVGQVGDLVESHMKRDAGIKESSRILPGHGGVLDRFDSLLFAAPAIYYYLKFGVYGSVS